MRTCNQCCKTKEPEKMAKGRNKCKDCTNKERREATAKKKKVYSTRRGGPLDSEWKSKVLSRDNFKCIRCGADKSLVCHHIIEWDKAPGLRFDVENGETLCRSCHARHHDSLRGHKHVQWNLGLKTGVGGPRGRKLTDERKAAISKFMSTRPVTEETRSKLKAARNAPENIALSKIRFKGKTWIINPESGKRTWIDKKD